MNPRVKALLPKEPVDVAYDCVLMRPACALVAAAMGGNSQVCHFFPLESWLLTKTPDMRLYSTTPEQLVLVIEKTERMLEATR